MIYRRAIRNVYRLLFRHYFDATLPLLRDRAFVSSFYQPYQFIEVDPGHLTLKSQ